MTMMIHGRPATMAALLKSPETRQALAEALSGVASLALKARVGALDAAQVEALLRERPDLVLVDLDLADAGEMEQLAQLKARCPAEVPVLVTARDPSGEGLRLLFRLGIADLQPQPLDPNVLLDGIGNALRSARMGAVTGDKAERGAVIAFLKAGGGVGATSLAVASAAALAVGGGGEAQTCLLDLDIQFGAAAMHLDVDHATSLVEMAESAGRLDRTLLRSAMARHRLGFDLLPAPELPHPLEAVGADAAATLIRAAAADYRHVLVDLPSSWTAWTRAVLAEASAIVLVLRLDVPSVRQARRQLETLAAEGLGELPVTLVANFRAAGFLAHEPVEPAEAERALGRPIAHSIPRADQAFAVAANEGLPLAEVKGGRRPARRVAAMIKAVVAACVQA